MKIHFTSKESTSLSAKRFEIKVILILEFFCGNLARYKSTLFNDSQKRIGVKKI
jgi:hypothetical protein